MASADHPAATTLPENLTHCYLCGQKFSEPMLHWDEFFAEVEDASFFCVSCSLLEGEQVDVDA